MRSPFLRAICVLSLLVASIQSVAAQLDGAFTLRSVDNDDRLSLNLVYDGHSNYGRMVARSALTDVVRTGDRITFTLRREPGTFTFEGRGSLDRASGWYGFAPNQGFAGDLAKLGFRGGVVELERRDERGRNLVRRHDASREPVGVCDWLLVSV